MHRFSVLAILLLCLSWATARECMAQSPARFGVNLDNSGAFVDIIKHTNRYGNASSYDSLGWPMSDFDLVLLDGRPATEWNGAIDDPEQYRVDYSGTYSCAFNGSATVRATGTSVSIQNSRYDSVSNTTAFDLLVGGFPGPNHGLVFLQFTGTRRRPADPTGTGITGLRVHRPGYPLNSPELFTDEYLALCRAADFACYRFYNLQNIWDGEPAYPAKTRWQQRKSPLDAAQVSMAALNGKRDGWCWEYIVALANILKKDIWVNIHQSCDSDYVAHLAAYLMQELDPSINIYVENSNEVWSPTQATHGPYNQSDAQAHGITFDQNYARRCVELSRWFGAVFGPQEINNRIRVVLAGQQSYHGRSDNHLNYIKDTFGDPKEFIFATSAALYFGSNNASSTDPRVINGGMLQAVDDQISSYRPVHIAKAATWGLKGGCTSYEGGPGLPSGGGTTNLGPQILAHRTQEMGEAIKRNSIEGWRNIGGGLAMYFTLVSGYNRYGCWGITDDYTNPDRNYKMRAIRDIISGASEVREADAPLRLGLEVCPNPAASVVTLNATRPVRMTVVNMLGRTVWESGVTQNANVDVSSWSSGVYFFRANSLVKPIVKL